ncbi:hypothetical protein [Streptomyces mirabilis]|uniref:hypothetical protein n=1 Tax=Streptomyces mirabilis TaxID=68239 RepID=UPI003677D198
MDDLVDQGTGRGGAAFIDYAEHGRAFPTRVRSAGLLGDLTITHSGRYALRASSKGADPQVLSIALPAQADELIKAFLDSQAFPDHLEHLVFSLYDHTGPVPALAVDACERIVQHAGSDLGDIRTHRAADGHYLVSVVLRLYRQSPQSQRIRCLDIIDRLAQAGAYNLNAALEYER